ncbi:cytosine deaminase [Colletotrichum scovillei]|uniref:cytosine deaminase n=1 Tax=Colletotrichum scovillei TaxID=1209932 RepID=UPI0015C3DFE8|nr:cytosine deaminase [Colletotrichum scovillei]KAF4781877.1 cytosine deaminase [Colletotrichum scovillei]
MNDTEGLAIAIEEAKTGASEGGVPIGAALVSADGKLLGRGHNRRVQMGSAIHHVSQSSLSTGLSSFKPHNHIKKNSHKASKTRAKPTPSLTRDACPERHTRAAQCTRLFPPAICVSFLPFPPL